MNSAKKNTRKLDYHELDQAMEKMAQMTQSASIKFFDKSF